MRRNNRILLYIGIADACAMATEFLRFPHDASTRQRVLAFTGYVAHPTHTDHRAGFYTDDAEMSCANAHVLIETRHTTAEPIHFADAYVAEFARGGCRTGYSRGFQTILERVGSGAELLSVLKPVSDKNGAAMRAVPFGVLPDPVQAMDLADRQARITHDTPEGRFSARAVALMAYYALQVPRPLSELPAYCLQHLPVEDVKRFGNVFRQRWSGVPVRSHPKNPVSLTTVHAVVDLVAHQPSLIGILTQAIRWGGDTDSVAAIAWGIASCHHQSEKLPIFLERDLEGGNRNTGAAYLVDLGTRLMDAYS